MTDLLPLAVLFIFTPTLGLFVLSALTWSRRGAPSARYLSLLLVAIGAWGLFYGLELVIGDPGLKVIWIRLKYVGITLVPIAVLAFVLHYTGNGRWMNRNMLLLGMIEPALVQLATWTNPLHGQFYPTVRLDFAFEPPLLITGSGWMFWTHAVYSYLLLMMTTLILAYSERSAVGPYRTQHRMLLVATLLPWAANVIHVFGYNPLYFLDITVIAFFVVGLVIYMALFHYRLLEINPIARNAVIENMQDGMLVLDPNRRILDVNPTVEKWMQMPAVQLIGKRLDDVLPDLAALYADRKRQNGEAFECPLHVLDRRILIEAQVSTIPGSAGTPASGLLLLRDVTSRRTVEESLWRTNELLERMFESIHLLVAYLDRDLTVQRMNQAFTHRLGIQVEDAIGKQLGRLISIQTRESLLRSVLETGESLALYGDPYFGADESTYWDWSAQPVRSESGEVVGLVFAAADATERERTARRLVETLELNQQIFSASDIGILAFNADGKCITANRAAARLAGLPVEQLLRVQLQDMEIFRESGLLVKAEETLSTGQSFRGIFHLPPQVGQEMWLDCALNVFHSGGEKHLLLMGHDFTDRKITADERRRSEARFHTLVDSMEDIVFTLDCEGRHTGVFGHWYEREGFTADHFIGRTSLDVFGQENGAIHQAANMCALQGENVIYEWQTTRNARPRYFQTSLSPMWEEGRVTGLVGVGREITAIKEIQQAERDQRVLAETFRDTAAALNSTIQLEQVLTLVLDNIERVVPHDAAHVILLNETGRIEQSRFRGYTQEEEKEVLDQVQRQVAGEGVAQMRALAVMADEPGYQRTAVSKNFHSTVSAAILYQDRLLGRITLNSRQPEYFSIIQADRLKVFADQAAIAIENARLYAEVQQLTLIDELTRVHNLRGLFALGQREFDRARRFTRPLSLLFYDIDNFRDFNNRYSHAVGNLVLQKVVQATRNILRGVDLVARYGGEEFVILLPETHLSSAGQIAERLRLEIEETYVETERGSLNVTISIGVAELMDEDETLPALIERANRAEHVAKKNGRNRVELDE